MTPDSRPTTSPASTCSISRVEHALGVLRGRWKLLIIHHLLIRRPRRFSDLERAIPEVTQKMLVQQLRALESDGVVRRIVYDEVPPHVEYELTSAGAELATALYALHDWAAQSRIAAPSRAGEGRPSGSGS